MHIYYKCRRRIFSALTTFLYSLLCCTAGCTSGWSPAKLLRYKRHCSQKQKVLFLAKRKLLDILWNGCIHSSRNFKKLWSRKIENKEMYYLSILVSHCSLVCIQGSLFFSPSAPRCLLGPLSPQTRRAIWARENSWELSIWILEQT